MTQSEFEKWFGAECYFRNQKIEEKVTKIRKERNRERLNRELKPCPFYGGKAEIVNLKENDGYCHYEVVKVQCQSCMASTESRVSDGYYELWCSDEEIAGLWNRRIISKHCNTNV